MRRLPGPAGWRLSEGDQTPEALSELFRDWQRTHTQSSVTALRSPRPQMDVWFCRMQEPSAERHDCAIKGPEPSRLRWSAKETPRHCACASAPLMKASLRLRRSAKAALGPAPGTHRTSLRALCGAPRLSRFLLTDDLHECRLFGTLTTLRSGTECSA